MIRFTAWTKDRNIVIKTQFTTARCEVIGNRTTTSMFFRCDVLDVGLFVRHSTPYNVDTRLYTQHRFCTIFWPVVLEMEEEIWAFLKQTILTGALILFSELSNFSETFPRYVRKTILFSSSSSYPFRQHNWFSPVSCSVYLI